MDVLTLLENARQAGLALSVDGDRLVVRGPRHAEALARDLLAQKDAVVALLERFEERAAIRQFDAGFSREEAERLALEDVLRAAS